MAIKKTVRPLHLPGVHPGLMQKIRDAEEAELRGELPKTSDGPQKVTRPSLEALTEERAAQARTIGLVDPSLPAGEKAKEALAEQSAFMPGVDLDTVWDELTENQKVRAGATERFRLEMQATLQRAAMPWHPPHRIGGRLDARNLGRAVANLEAEIEAYDYLLADDSRRLLERFVDQTRNVIAVCLRQRAVSGIAGALMADLMRDWVHKLIYQELVSRRRAMGDHGIRRICGTIELADRVYDALQRLPDYSPRQRLLMRIIHVHQGLGYTAYAARVSYRGSRLHRAYGARIFTDEINSHRALLTFGELEIVRAAVATHSSEELPFAQERVLALARAVDHLTPFAPHRISLRLAEIDGVPPLLDAMREQLEARNVDGYLQAKDAVREHLANCDLPRALRDDIMAGFRPFERLADPIDLGERAGDVAGLDLQSDDSGGTLRATLATNAFAQRYQVLFDHGQDQLMRVARHLDVTPQVVRSSASLRLQAEGFGALLIEQG